MRTMLLLGWGIVIYAIMYTLVAGLSLYGWYPGMASRIAALVVLILLATVAGRSVRAQRVFDILPYSLLWTLEVAGLDAIMSVPYAGWHLYLNWNVWVGYALVAIVPLFGALQRRLPAASRDL